MSLQVQIETLPQLNSGHSPLGGQLPLVGQSPLGGQSNVVNPVIQTINKQVLIEEVPVQKISGG